MFGLLCASNSCPVAVEVFEGLPPRSRAKAGGNTADLSTLVAQVNKLKQRFHLEHVVLVGDRGMITEARIDTLLRPAGLDWITALRAPTIRTLLDQGAFQLSLFDERDLAEVTSPEFPGERLVVCRNPLLAAERGRKRLDLLAATEADLRKVAKAVARKTKPLRGADKIGLAAGAVLHRHRRVGPGISPPPASRRTEREALASLGSHQANVPVMPSLPVNKEIRALPGTVFARTARADLMAFKALKLPHRPGPSV